MMLASQTELNGKIRKKSQVKLRMTLYQQSVVTVNSRFSSDCRLFSFRYRENSKFRVIPTTDTFSLSFGWTSTSSLACPSRKIVGLDIYLPWGISGPIWPVNKISCRDRNGHKYQDFGWPIRYNNFFTKMLISWPRYTGIICTHLIFQLVHVKQ